MMMQIISRSFRAAIAIGVVFCACIASGQVPATTQPALAKFAEPYAESMRKVGIKSVMVYGSGARVRVATRMGEVYFRYPAGLSRTDFALYLEAQGVEVDSDAFNAGNSAQYEAALKAVLPEAIKWTNSNNTRELEQQLGGR
jgi:hypothetical protein